MSDYPTPNPVADAYEAVCHDRDAAAAEADKAERSLAVAVEALRKIALGPEFATDAQVARSALAPIEENDGG